MKKTNIVLVLFFLCASVVAQTKTTITSKGFENIKWGTNKSKFTKVKCANAISGEQYQNCADTTGKLFYGYNATFFNYRFFKNKLIEVNVDFDRSFLAYIVGKLTIDLGSPLVKEKDSGNNNRNANFTMYVWNIGGTRVVVFDKGQSFPVWCTISSIKMKKKIKGNKDTDILIE